MILIHWKNSFEIDQGIIDEQHQKLIRLINDLYTAFYEGQANKVIEAIIVELEAYTRYHFETEEALFSGIGFDQEAKHLQQHRFFEEKIKHFKEDFINEDLRLSYEIMNFLRDWLQNHILDSDKKYIPYIGG